MFWIKERFLWIGIAIVIVVMMVFGLAMMGSSLSAKPQDLPVALVSLDQQVELPDGSDVAVGDMVAEQLLENKELPIKWDLLESEHEALEGMEQQKYYGALVLREDLSQSFMSLQTAEPQQGSVQIFINEGMNMQAASAVRKILDQVIRRVSNELADQVIAQASQATEVLPISTVGALRTPLVIEETVLHLVGENHANGNSPNLLTQIIWFSCIAISAIMFFVSQKHRFQRGSRFIPVMFQVLFGLLVVNIASGFLMWMASSWYGMEIGNKVEVWLFLLFVGSVFFLLQSALLNWIGVPAMALLVLLFFFSMPVIGMPPEFMPDVAKDWLYSWTPFRFASSGLRNIMYFDGATSMSANYAVLWSIGAVSSILLAVSPYFRRAWYHPKE